MNAELKQKWIDALRSGEYVQQRSGQLKFNGRHCCLAVFCEVAKIPHNDMEMLDEKGKEIAYDPIENILGEKVVETLYLMNDHKSTFPEIADYIEQNL